MGPLCTVFATFFKSTKTFKKYLYLKNKQTKSQSFLYPISSSALLGPQPMGHHPISLLLFSPRTIQKVTCPHRLHILPFHSLPSPLPCDFCNLPIARYWGEFAVCMGLSAASETIVSSLLGGGGWSLIIWCLWQCAFLLILTPL